MATYAGTEGSVRIGANAIGEVRNWTAEFTTDIADISTLGVAFEKNRGTIKRASGTVECFADPDDPRQNQIAPGAQVTLTLVMTTGKQLTVPVTVENVSYDQGGPAGVVQRNFTWKGNGAYTLV